MIFLNKKKGPALFELALETQTLPRLTLAVVLTQVPFVVIDVALVFVAVFAVMLHITPVVINVALIVIAIHAVMVKVLL